MHIGPDLPETCFFFGIFAGAVHVVSTGMFGYRISDDTELVNEIFTSPFLGAMGSDYKYMRARFFIPWTPPPAEMEEHTRWDQFVFLLARLSGTAMIAGLLTVFPSAFLINL